MSVFSSLHKMETTLHLVLSDFLVFCCYSQVKCLSGFILLCQVLHEFPFYNFTAENLEIYETRTNKEYLLNLIEPHSWVQF